MSTIISGLTDEDITTTVLGRPDPRLQSDPDTTDEAGDADGVDEAGDADGVDSAGDADGVDEAGDADSTDA